MSFHTIDDGRGIFPQLCVELDVTNKPTNSTRVWTDITTDVRRISYVVGGRNDELQQSQPGTLRVTLSNKNAKYDPTNASGIGIKKRQWIRVRAQWNSVVYPRWMGILQTIPQTWPEAGADAVVTLSAIDALGIANLYDLEGQTFSSQQSDQRVSAVATLLGLTATLDDSGASLIVAVSDALPPNSQASTHLTDIENTENGFVFADWNGAIVFQSRHYRALNSASSSGTLGDGAGEIPYKDNTEVVSDDAYIGNASYVTTTNADGSTGSTETAMNSASADDYFQSTPDVLRRTILSSDTNEALACAQFLVNKYADPSPRIPKIDLGMRKTTAQWATVLAAANSTRFTFKRRASNVISEDVFVEQVSEEIVPNTSWKTSFQLSPATDQAVWILGDSVNGVLGSTTALSY